MGNGIYGENQGDESRSAGRHNGQAMMDERLTDNELVEGEVVQTLRNLWNSGVLSLFDGEVNKIRDQWLAAFIPGGPVSEADYRDRVEKRLQSIITRATVGDPRALRKEGGTLRNGAKVTMKDGKVARGWGYTV